MRQGPVSITQETRYPWDGAVRVRVTPRMSNKKFAVCLRIPGWSQNEPVPSDLYRYRNPEKQEITLDVNGDSMPLHVENGYVRIHRAWEQGDIIELALPMPIQRVEAHENVEADRGKVALERGPLVFCAEWPDSPDGHVRNLFLKDDVPLNTEFRPDLLRGVQVISGKVEAYKIIDDKETVEKSEKNFLAIPYYAWAHRGKGEMTVWLAREEPTVNPLGQPTLASISKVSASFGKNPEAVQDLLEPKTSSDQEVPFFHWWPHKGAAEWIQYDFPELSELSMTEVYWFDDTGRGECRPPQSWRILYWDGKEWSPVYTVEKYGVEKDTYNTMTFETVQTNALRLEINSLPGFAGGIHEWRVK